jgi:SagB-type dehydrogenase family enzyme
VLQFDWNIPMGPFLAPQREERLFELYHENSKLSAAQTKPGSATPFELYVASRGFRQYHASPRTALPDMEPSTEALQSVMLRRRSARELRGPISLCALGTLLHQALGPTAVVQNADLGVEQALRSWPSAGGLYPIDTYLITSRVEGVPPGLHHYNVLRSELERLESRATENILRDGFFRQDFVTSAALVVLLVAAFERTTSKYGERGYRLVLLDAGHAAQNLLLVAEQLGLGAIALGGFADDVLADDLGVDGISEAVIHAVAVGSRHE